MKKIISIILLSIFFFNSSYAEKYWSNKKDGPTNVGVAVYLFDSQRRDYSSKKILPLHGIWYSHHIGFVHIYPDSINENPSYKVSLIKPPRQLTSDQKKDYIFHIGTIEATIVPQKEKVNEFIYYHKVWYDQNDGSYNYKTENDELIILGKNHFAILDKQPEYTELPDNTLINNFVRIYPTTTINGFDIKKYLQKTYRGMGDYDMYTYNDGTLLVRLNEEKERKDKKGKSKFTQISADGTISIGKYAWDKNDKSKIIWDSIYCKNNILYIQNIKYNPDKKIKSYCDPNKITYFTYLYYKYRNFIFILGALISGAIIFYTIQFRRKNELANYNKKNKKKFETYLEYKEHLQILSDIEWEKDQKQQEKEKKAQEIIRKAQEAKRLKEEQKLEAEEKRREKLEREPVPVSIEESNDDNLMGKIKRLKVLYKNGTLTKTEFEKAKNKLLK